MLQYKSVVGRAPVPFYLHNVVAKAGGRRGSSGILVMALRRKRARIAEVLGWERGSYRESDACWHRTLICIVYACGCYGLTVLAQFKMLRADGLGDLCVRKAPRDVSTQTELTRWWPTVSVSYGCASRILRWRSQDTSPWIIRHVFYLCWEYRWSICSTGQLFSSKSAQPVANGCVGQVKCPTFFPHFQQFRNSSKCLWISRLFRWGWRAIFSLDHAIRVWSRCTGLKVTLYSDTI